MLSNLQMLQKLALPPHSPPKPHLPLKRPHLFGAVEVDPPALIADPASELPRSSSSPASSPLFIALFVCVSHCLEEALVMSESQRRPLYPCVVVFLLPLMFPPPRHHPALLSWNAICCVAAQPHSIYFHLPRPRLSRPPVRAVGRCRIFQPGPGFPSHRRGQYCLLRSACDLFRRQCERCGSLRPAPGCLCRSATACIPHRTTPHLTTPFNLWPLLCAEVKALRVSSSSLVHLLRALCLIRFVLVPVYS